eukprot:50411-Pleurochrysis_carterae.AAC.3
MLRAARVSTQARRAQRVALKTTACPARSVNAQARRADVCRGRANGEAELGTNVPVVAKVGGRVSRKSRPPATKYMWTRHRPHTQGKASGDEVMAMASAPAKSAAWCMSVRVRWSSRRYGAS